jgi:hypothetical protein
MNLSLVALLFCLCILLCNGQSANDGVKPNQIQQIDQNPIILNNVPLKFSGKYRRESKQKYGYVLVRSRSKNQQRINVGSKTKND